MTFGRLDLLEPSRTLTVDRHGPVRCLDALPFGEPEISSEVDPLTSAALKNHPDIARGNTVIWVGRVDRVFASDIRLASATAIRTVAHDDLQLARWHPGSIANRPILCNCDDSALLAHRLIGDGVLSDIDHGDGQASSLPPRVAGGPPRPRFAPATRSTARCRRGAGVLPGRRRADSLLASPGRVRPPGCRTTPRRSMRRADGTREAPPPDLITPPFHLHRSHQQSQVQRWKTTCGTHPRWSIRPLGAGDSPSGRDRAAAAAAPCRPRRPPGPARAAGQPGQAAAHGAVRPWTAIAPAVPARPSRRPPSRPGTPA